MKILVLNAGSSSIKFQLFEMGDSSVLAGGSVERIGEPQSEFVYKKYREGVEQSKSRSKQAIHNHKQGLTLIANQLLDPDHGSVEENEIQAVGHRVVHGGEQFSQPTVVTDEILKILESLSFLAPLHNPANLKGIEIATKLFPHAIQVAVFDTAFHQSLPDFAYRFPIPEEYYAKHGLRVYGFHGTSHAYVSKRAAAFLGLDPSNFNCITVHLGNGCSMAAIKEGKSVDVSMGLTPVGGLIMGTRSGDIDPGLLLFLAEQLKLSIGEIDKLLNKESGLKGLTGDNDLRKVLDMYEKGEESARLAISMYTYRIKKFIGAYMAALGKVDAIVFTAGVGENSPLIRSLVCQNLEIMGIALSEERNAVRTSGPRKISSEESKLDVLVVPTNEELEIAQQTKEVITCKP